MKSSGRGDLSERSVYIAGTGTLAEDIAEYAVAAGFSVTGRVELIDRARIGNVIDGAPVIGPEARPCQAEAVAVIAVAGDRREYARALRAHGWALVSIVHPSAVVSPSSQIGEGVILGPLAVLGAQSRIADLVQVGRGALVGHHVELGAGAVLHPGSNLGGTARVGAGATIGIGATVVSGAIIGEEALIAAGAVVVRDVSPKERVQGVPARAFRPDRMDAA